jgi:hypothetical protein
MSHKIETTAPDEVRAVLRELADLMDVYSDDQIAAQRFSKSPTHKKECVLRAAVYCDLADELREIVVTQGGVDVG